MRKHWKNKITLITILFSFLLLTSCKKSNEHAEHADVYTCPMHPTVISDKPGICSVCGMDLVRKARPGEDVKITEELARLMKSPNEAVVASIRTIKPDYKTVPVSVEAVGMVTYDTRNIYTVVARVEGRIEKMYLKYEFQEVRKGQPIAEIYSPELLTSQRELLYLIENDSKNLQLIDGAKRRLGLLGLSTFQINDLIMRRETNSVFTIHSPYNGYLITSDAAPSVPQGMAQSSGAGDVMSEMGSSSSGASSSSNVVSSNSPSATLIREGDYVTAGQTLVKVVNTSALRIELDLPGAQSGIINLGDKIELDLGSAKRMQASVDFVQPFFDEGQNFLKIRVYARNANDLYIGQLVRAAIKLKPKESLWVTNDAVLDLGTDKVVFVKEHGILRPKKIMTGIRAGELIEVISGLASSEEIAANAHYLVDSESFIKPVE